VDAVDAEAEATTGLANSKDGNNARLNTKRQWSIVNKLFLFICTRPPFFEI
jgi:hypothetical protein